MGIKEGRLERQFECLVILLLALTLVWAQSPGHFRPPLKENERRPAYTKLAKLRLAAKARLSSTPEPSTSSVKPDVPLGYIILSMKESPNTENTYPTTSNSNEDVYEDGSSTARILELNPSSGDFDLDKDCADEGTEVEKNDLKTPSLMGGFLKREIWTIPLLSMAGLNIFLISLFEIYVLCKAKGRGPLFLGQMLLFGLFLCSSLALVFVIFPTVLSCYLARIGISFSYTLVLSVLMVKCMFLLSLDSGVNLTVPYQACLLLFSVLVQVAINIQWVIASPPTLNVSICYLHKYSFHERIDS